uniref:U-box domain-containing protein 62-like n=1 Tax=Erigeron canadensis TaxID=72917 RepID=UPI001CB95FA9|nr:U-box domain-containing protein 62-like [Erigeron canadensis]
MASEEIALHRPQNHHQQQTLFFQNDNHHLNGNTINNKTTRELTRFIEHQNPHFQPNPNSQFRRSIFEPSDDDDDDDNGSDTPNNDDDEDDEGGHVLGFVNTNTDNNNSNNNLNSNNVTNNRSSEKNGINGKRNHLSTTGNDVTSSSNDGDRIQGELCLYQNAVTTVAHPNGEMYYPHCLNGMVMVVEGSSAGSGIKDVLVDDGSCGFSGRKDVSNSGESLRAILSDPLTGALMDDAMILSCGHSFGSSGMQHVMRIKACYTCSHPVSEGSVSPNLSLRSAVHAFLREEGGQTHRVSKRRNRLDQDGVIYGDSALADQSRSQGVQFPFRVTERVIIKGNKRTPPRFVGREAIVTTQCLNGWYVVKTLDNAESVKLQYRSLAKVQDSQKPSTLA